MKENNNVKSDTNMQRAQLMAVLLESSLAGSFEGCGGVIGGVSDILSNRCFIFFEGLDR